MKVMEKKNVANGRLQRRRRRMWQMAGYKEEEKECGEWQATKALNLMAVDYPRILNFHNSVCLIDLIQ